MGNPTTPATEKAVKKIQFAIFPLSASSTHLGRLPALSIAALEMKVFGPQLVNKLSRMRKPPGNTCAKTASKSLQKRKVLQNHINSQLTSGVLGAATKSRRTLKTPT